MKILYFGGGLGNQIFEYAFYLTLKDKFPKEKIYGIYLKSRFKEHVSGLEMEKVFDVKFPPVTSFVAKMLTVILYAYKKLNPNTKYCSLHDTFVNWNAIVFKAFKTDLSFYCYKNDWIRFKNISLSLKNQQVIQQMHEYNSVSIHVRRGDFLSQKYSELLDNIATPSYYSSAIKIVETRLKDIRYFIFSDDIEWCRDNLPVPSNSVFVDWNTEKNSYIDMFLMTHCKANIIANSTFSYWGSYLNKNNPIVIYPKKWINATYYPQIFPSDWIGLESE